MKKGFVIIPTRRLSNFLAQQFASECLHYNKGKMLVETSDLFYLDNVNFGKILSGDLVLFQTNSNLFMNRF